MSPMGHRSFSRPLEERLWADRAARHPLPPLVRDAGSRDAVPPAPAQESMWLFDRLAGGEPVYNVSEAFRIEGPLDVRALETALAQTVGRHDAFRTSFFECDGRPLMRVAQRALLELRRIDLRGRASDAAIDACCRAQARRPFDLAQAPLMRVSLIALAERSHILLFVIHHAIQDGTSRGVLYRELSRRYDNLVRGTAPAFDPLPIGFLDFVAWQRTVLSGPALEKQRRFWREYFAEPPAPLVLPADRPRPVMPTYRGAQHRTLVPAAVLAALKELARAHGASLFMTLMAAFSALLHRYTGLDDLAVGFPTAGRLRPETAAMIGCFINTLVMRADLGGDPTFGTHLERVRATLLAAYDNQDLPFETLVEELQCARTLNRTPLFSVMAQLIERRRETLALSGLTVSPLPVDTGTSILDLTLDMREDDDGLSCRFGYNSDIFDESSIVRFAGHFRTLLAGIVAAPERPISQFELLDGDERRTLLERWAGSTDKPPSGSTMHALVEAQVRQTPERIAVEFRDQRLTYRELNAWANELARELRRHDVAPDVLVGLCMERAPQMIVGMLAILKAGGALLPLDPSLPADRLRGMIADARTTLVLTDPGLEAIVAMPGVQTLLLGRAPRTSARGDDANLPPGVGAEDLAYVLYTSGSTGRPKGVAVPHRAMCNHMASFAHRQLIVPDDRLLAKYVIGVDVALFECFGPLVVGACVVLAEPDGHRDGAYLVRTIAERAITIIDVVPTMLATIVDDPRFARCRSLRRVLVGGEVLTPELKARFFAGSAAELYNVYGPTETAISSTVWPCSRHERVTLIGRPIANTKVYVLDQQAQPVPIGVAGELFIGGAGLARGYLNDPELTARAFVASPFGDADAPRLYRTGDRVRFRADGNLEYLGRADRQIKVRGNRIELGEIESQLQAHPAIRACAVTEREDFRGERGLAAYLVLRGAGDPPSTAELRAFLARTLPGHMLPQWWSIVPDLPLTSSGKIDVRALPEPAAEDRPATLTTARSATERAVAQTWAAILGRREIERSANFFDLGGHSLLAARALARINQQHGVDLSLRTFFAYPTIEGLAGLIDRMPKNHAPDATITTRPGSSGAVDASVAALSDREVDDLLTRFLGA